MDGDNVFRTNTKRTVLKGFLDSINKHKYDGKFQASTVKKLISTHCLLNRNNIILLGNIVSKMMWLFAAADPSNSHLCSAIFNA